MTSKERMDIAMHLGTPDRVPVMCQLALGHYFLNTGLDPIAIWHTSEAFGDALILLQQRYGFDGILINLPGRDPNWRSFVRQIEDHGDEKVITWVNGWTSVCPPDDLPHVYREDGTRFAPLFEEIHPDQLFYVEPYDISGIKYPYSWGFAEEPALRGKEFFPPYQHRTLKYVLDRVGNDVSVHAEIFSPFSQFMELLDYSNGLMALMDDPGKVKACLEALAEGAIELGCSDAATGAHAILISSAFAGGGFISRQHYSEFVLPYERKVIQGIKSQFPDLPIYTHTCGAIGDRLDLMEQTGTNGIDTLDPAPLGNVELADAKEQTFGKMFIKGNIDAVNTLLLGTPEQALLAARERIETAAPGGGYILSTACSVAPAAPPDNILQLRKAAELYGRYPDAAHSL
ncbi:MAG TPA: uroporphyrinogen decarboxylase family protein [Terriglobales bacterium]|nr:uroporphyrinogen decarboxylase family protein [Terriglobales bacterium]